MSTTSNPTKSFSVNLTEQRAALRLKFRKGEEELKRRLKERAAAAEAARNAAQIISVETRDVPIIAWTHERECTTEIIPGDIRRPLPHGEAYQGPDLPKDRKETPDLEDATSQALFEALASTISDEHLHWVHRFRARLQALFDDVPENISEILQDKWSLGTLLASQKLDKKHGHADREYREYVREGDTETEIGRQTLGDAEDRARDLLDQKESVDLVLEAQTAVYHTLHKRVWSAEDRTNRKDMPAPGTLADWQKQVQTVEFMKKRRIVVMGGNSTEEIAVAIEKIDAAHAKLGAELAVITGDTQTGFEMHIYNHCLDKDIPAYRFPLKDRNHENRRRFIERNEQMFDQMKPTGVIVSGGGGYQGNIIELANQRNIPKMVPICPTGWIVDGEKGLRRNR